MHQKMITVSCSCASFVHMLLKENSFLVQYCTLFLWSPVFRNQKESAFLFKTGSYLHQEVVKILLELGSL